MATRALPLIEDEPIPERTWRSQGPGGSSATRWSIERIVHFEPGELCKGGFVHFGFHDREGRHYLVEHQRHFFGLVGEGDRLEWTVARRPILSGVPNIQADLRFPMYVDSLPGGDLVVSNLGTARIYRVDVPAHRASLFVDGQALGMKDAGNCVVDDRGHVWVNEVEGCRVWEFDSLGEPLRQLGDGVPGFQADEADFSEARFAWIYDLRRGPGGDLYVLDSRNFALRVIDPKRERVRTVAGTGKGGYSGDGGPARFASFGSDPTARFDGPISLSVDEVGNLFIGDRFNRVVRMIDHESGRISTIAGDSLLRSEERNDPLERDPLRLRLPMISSMDYAVGRLLVPTDLAARAGDLAVLVRSP